MTTPTPIQPGCRSSPRHRTPNTPRDTRVSNGAAAAVLLAHFDDAQMFKLTTAGRPPRMYTSVSDARSDGNNGRVWGGMHYRSTVEISDAMGEAIAQYVNSVAMQQVHGNDR